MRRRSDRQIIQAKLAEWDITLTEKELNELLPAYRYLLRSHKIIEDMLHQRKVADGMIWPESEPLQTYCIEKEEGPR
jgi:hypothetical protein